MTKGNTRIIPEQLVDILPRGGLKPQEPKVTQTVTTKEVNTPISSRELKTQVQDVALQHSVSAIEFYASILSDPSASIKDRMAAADRILDRAVGKAQQVATVHGTSTQTNLTAGDFLEALKGTSMRQAIDVTPVKDDPKDDQGDQ